MAIIHLHVTFKHIESWEHFSAAKWMILCKIRKFWDSFCVVPFYVQFYQWGPKRWQIKTKKGQILCRAESQMAAFTTGGGLGAGLKSKSMLRIWRRFKRVTIDIFIGFTHLKKMTFNFNNCRVFCMCTIFKSLTKSNKDAIWLKKFII